MELLAPGRARPDGLPAYMLDAWPVEDQQTLTGRRCTLVRYIAAAAACDLGDYPMSEVSVKAPNLHDDDARRTSEPAKAVEHRRYGRGILAELGAGRGWTRPRQATQEMGNGPSLPHAAPGMDERAWEEYRPVEEERERQRAIIEAALAGAPNLTPEQIAEQEEGERALRLRGRAGRNLRRSRRGA